MKATKKPLTMREKAEKDDYIPFGNAWEKSVMRLKKIEIMRLYRDMCIEKLKLEKRIKEAK